MLEVRRSGPREAQWWTDRCSRSSHHPGDRLNPERGGWEELLYLAGVIVFAEVVLVDQPVSPLQDRELWSWQKNSQLGKNTRKKMSGLELQHQAGYEKWQDFDLTYFSSIFTAITQVHLLCKEEQINTIPWMDLEKYISFKWMNVICKSMVFSYFILHPLGW